MIQNILLFILINNMTEDIIHITNYQKYFKNNKVLYKDILNIIKEFKHYYDTQKI